ncbi:hypothetical protein CRUP_026046 [Coryphaenoides rupestris]|nr:hypothetical protein CRUP_026046 [Coryphaenoides rupestris]
MPTSSIGSGRHFSEHSCSVEDHHDPSLPGGYQERCVDPPQDQPRGNNGRNDSKGRQKAHLKDADGEEAETVVFLAGSVEPGGGARTCAWCRSVVCRVLTCGLYRVCQRTLLAPCLSGPPDPPENKERSEEEEEEEAEDVREERDEYQDEPAWLEDVHFDGVKVDIHRGDLIAVTQAPSSSYGRPPPSSRPEQHCQTSRRSNDSVTLGDWEEEEGVEEVYGGEGVDALIHKKLLALYTEYQIEELARLHHRLCSKEIHHLINSLAEEHQMDEQEAECRLVRGIIRISTRRSKRRVPPHYAVSERTQSDSGNETMRNSDSCSCSNNNDYKSNPNFQISEVTHSDMSLFAVHGHRVIVGGLCHSHLHRDVILGGPRHRDAAHTGPRGHL